jgi:hypothetical protein
MELSSSVPPPPLTLSPVSNKATTDEQRKVISSLNLIRDCVFASFVCVVSYAAVVTFVIACCCYAAIALPIFCLMVGAAILAFLVVGSIMDFRSSQELELCRNLAKKIKDSDEENSNRPYVSLCKWLQNPLTANKDFLSDAPAVRAFASLVNQDDSDATGIFKRFTHDEQEYIHNCADFDNAKLEGNDDTSDGIELEDIMDGGREEQIS